MIEEKEVLTGSIAEKQVLTGELDRIIEVIEPVTQEKEVTPTKETQNVEPDEGYTGLSSVVVNPIPPEYIIPSLGQKTIVNNGTYNASDEALDGYSSVSVNVDAFQVNGKIENKVIQSGSVAKGDIVAKGIAEKTDRLSDTTDYELYNSTSSLVWPDRLLDNDDNTFGRVTNSTSTPGIYIRCKNRQALGIPTYAKILSFTTKYKIAWVHTAQGSTGSGMNVVYGRLVNGEWDNKKTVGGYNKTYPTTASQSAFVDEFEFPNLFLNQFDDTDTYQIRFYATATRYVYLDLYYVDFIITYEDDGVIKTVTSLGETICGVANQNGNQGDTIEVFVPNVE